MTNTLQYLQLVSKIGLLILLPSGVTTISSAQGTLRFVVPIGAETTEGSSAAGSPFSDLQGHAQQYIPMLPISAGESIFLTDVSFRLDGGTTILPAANLVRHLDNANLVLSTALG